MNSIQNFVAAVSLREKGNLAKIPNDKPGYYKWWATKDTLMSVFCKLRLTDKEIAAIKDDIETKDNYYCIYIGVAIKDSIQNRINTHVNQYNPERNVRCSTLRKSLAGLFAHNKQDVATTNKIIDRLFVEYFPVELPIKSDIAKETIGGIEKSLLNCKYLYILNIQENYHPKVYITKSRLTALRQKE